MASPSEGGDRLRKASMAVMAGVKVGTPKGTGKAGSRNNVRVGVRCRPLSKTELDLQQESIVQFTETSILLTNPNPAPSEHSEHILAFDHIYGLEATAVQVFEEMASPLVDALFEGFNGTILAYGQTGSGKTHSMMGSKADPGVIPRVAVDIFRRIGKLGTEVSATVTASYLQIYCEELQDLLADSKKDHAATTRNLLTAHAQLKIRRDPQRGTYVQGLKERALTSSDELEHLIEQGNARRAVAATKMNATSSRSHAVVLINMEQNFAAHGTMGKRRISSKCYLVDLAGSERASKTGAEGETLKEAIAINQSLSALGNVINALTDPKNKGHIPYRSSKLTHLLEESLGGNSKTARIPPTPTPSIPPQPLFCLI